MPPLKQAHVGFFLQHIQFTNPVQSQAAKVKVVVTQTGAVQSTHAPITNGLTSKRQKIAIAIPREGRIMGRPQGKASKKCLRRHATALSTPPLRVFKLYQHCKTAVSYPCQHVHAAIPVLSYTTIIWQLVHRFVACESGMTAFLQKTMTVIQKQLERNLGI